MRILRHKEYSRFRRFKQILMEPVFPEKLNYVNASHVSPYGRIGSSWKRDGNKLEWNVEIPANTTATVKLPLDFHVQVDAGQAGIHSVEEADGKLVVELGSGKYVSCLNDIFLTTIKQM